ncbi:MAG TPA: SsrA-binding protein [Dehalococcoidia bacterium]|jgi:SsrA-binding protein|nr:SsrA-binding protein [Dehalococcoidia bacterium]|tara:strand:+ start:493 stop:978 length:486 start_codon:yes stop_codon:yes gene_type:complete
MAKKKIVKKQQKETAIAVNRRAFFNYEILKRFEVGIMLTGTEIKSVRDNKVDLRDAYAKDIKGEMWLFNSHISTYVNATINNHDPKRDRKLLLHKEQINELSLTVSRKGYTLIPLKIYFKRSRAKLELGLATGKRQYDKRRVLKDREMDREAQRALKSYGN